MQLPSDFVELMRRDLGADLAERLFRGLADEPQVSIRLNPRKAGKESLPYEPVPWCEGAYYLPSRPSFTFDPMLHAGAYYVQEASSMYLDTVLRKHMPTGDLCALDLCAAPGGKSTLLRSRLSEDSLLVSNEPVRQRANILLENMTKWGYPNTLVTNNYPHDFTHLRQSFQIIVADVPCSGEGMFRKDAQAIEEWSLDNVRACQQRQRDIVQTIWPCLCDGGLFVYSTCTFNSLEDEDNVRWLMSHLGAELLEQRHFLPGRDKGEGFFIAAFRKPQAGDSLATPCATSDAIRRTSSCVQAQLRVLPVPEGASPLLLSREDSPYPFVPLTREQAISYLRREAVRTEAPRGMVVVTCGGLPLGLAKSVGTRLNNLYPHEWRIRTTHTPTDIFTLPSLGNTGENT